MKRFYLPELPIDVAPGQALTLDGSEAHHLLHVLRIAAGETVEIFDGRGGSAAARVAGATRREVRLEATSPRYVQARAALRVTLATCVPKQDRFRWLVEKATELGVFRIIPLRTERSVVDPRVGKLERLHDTIIQACKQCGRNDLLTIDAPVDWREFIRRWPADAPAGTSTNRLCVASSQGERWFQIAADSPQGAVADVTIAVGPEGGFTDAEVETALQAGAKLVSLGTHTLRTETAAIAAASQARAFQAEA
jgi:16S rRNA (uracil1498-N3)-methyltransferase